MIICLVPHSNLLLSDFEPQLSINLLSCWGLRRNRVILEKFTYVVEQLSDRQHDRGRFQVIPAIQEELSVLVSLCSGLSEPVVSLFHILPVQVQLAECVLRILVAALSRLGQVFDGFFRILWSTITQEIELPQPVAGILVALRGGFFKPVDSFFNPFPTLQQLADQATVEQTTDQNGLQAIKVTFDGGILFPTGKYSLNPQAQADLSRFAVNLNNNPGTNVQIYGFTDNTGSYAVNERLSNQRADAVLSYLANSGVKPARLHAQGIPMADYVASNDTPAGRAQNRRVEIYITASPEMVQQAEAGTLR